MRGTWNRKRDGRKHVRSIHNDESNSKKYIFTKKHELFWELRLFLMGLSDRCQLDEELKPLEMTEPSKLLSFRRKQKQSQVEDTRKRNLKTSLSKQLKKVPLKRTRNVDITNFMTPLKRQKNNGGVEEKEKYGKVSNVITTYQLEKELESSSKMRYSPQQQEDSESVFNEKNTF